jgi:hypothetical protein
LSAVHLISKRRKKLPILSDQEQQTVSVTCIEHDDPSHVAMSEVGLPPAIGPIHYTYWCGDERISLVSLPSLGFMFGDKKPVWETCKELGPSDEDGDQRFGSHEEAERMILRHFALKNSIPVAEIKFNRIRVNKHCHQIKCWNKPEGLQ